MKTRASVRTDTLCACMNAPKTISPLVIRQLRIAGFCLIPALVNWYWYCRTDYGREYVLWGDEFGLIVSGLAISFGLVIWLLWSVWRKHKVLRSAGSGVPEIRWLLSCLAGIYLLPLFLRFQFYSTWAVPGRGIATRFVHYGHPQLSRLLFVFSFVCLVLFQVRAQLDHANKTRNNKQMQRTPR
jgi:hypothetical protein